MGFHLFFCFFLWNRYRHFILLMMMMHVFMPIFVLVLLFMFKLLEILEPLKVHNFHIFVNLFKLLVIFTTLCLILFFSYCFFINFRPICAFPFFDLCNFPFCSQHLVFHCTQPLFALFLIHLFKGVFMILKFKRFDDAMIIWDLAKDANFTIFFTHLNQK